MLVSLVRYKTLLGFFLYEWKVHIDFEVCFNSGFVEGSFIVKSSVDIQPSAHCVHRVNSFY